MSKAYSMNSFYRVVGTEGRISGTWVVMLPARRDRSTIIKPHDVTFYDEAHHSGMIAGPDDLVIWVRQDDSIDIPEHMIREAVRDDVLDAIDELRALVPSMVAAALTPDGQETA
jgi:hypothetical protein